jgi:hypothetical protein
VPWACWSAPARQVAAHFLASSRPGLALGTGFEVPGVPALVHVGPAAVQLDDARGDPIEDVTVVGDEQQAAAVRRQPAFQPRNGAHVEVVGRFVEDQQDVVARLVRWAHLHQRPGQGDPLGLATRQRGQRRIEPTAEAEVIQDRGGLPTRPDRLADRRPMQIGVLVQHHDAGIAATAHGAGLRRGPSGKLAQQRRLPAAVQPHDGDAISRRDRQRDAGEQLPPGARRAKVGGVEQDHRPAGYGRPSPWSPDPSPGEMFGDHEGRERRVR